MSSTHWWQSLRHSRGSPPRCISITEESQEKKICLGANSKQTRGLRACWPQLTRTAACSSNGLWNENSQSLWLERSSSLIFGLGIQKLSCLFFSASKGCFVLHLKTLLPLKSMAKLLLALMGVESIWQLFCLWHAIQILFFFCKMVSALIIRKALAEETVSLLRAAELVPNKSFNFKMVWGFSPFFKDLMAWIYILVGERRQYLISVHLPFCPCI